MRSSWLLLLGLAGCVPESGPRQLAVAIRLHPSLLGGEAVRWDAVTWGVRVLRVQPCPTDPPFDPGDTDSELPRPQAWTTGLGSGVSLIDGRRRRIPVGPWCGFDLLTEGPVVAKGEVGAAGRKVSVEVDVPDLVADVPAPLGEVVITQRPTEAGGTQTRAEAVPWVLELGGPDWLAGADDGGDVDVEPGAGAHDALRDALVAGAALYLDVDRSADLSDEERAAGPIARLFPGPTATPAP